MKGLRDCFRVLGLMLWQVVILGRADVVVTLPGGLTPKQKELP